MVEARGIDLRCGAGRLGLQGATGTLPSALGFDSPLLIRRYKKALPEWAEPFCMYKSAIMIRKPY